MPSNYVEEEVEIKSDIELDSDSMELGIEVTSIEGQEPRVKQKRWCPAHISQIDMEHDFDTSRRTKRHFNLAASKILSYKRQIASINRQKLRITKKIEHLQSLLKELADKKMISEEAEMIIQAKYHTGHHKTQTEIQNCEDFSTFKSICHDTTFLFSKDI